MGLAILTGKINNIFVVDIDNLDHWEELLKVNKQKEPNTVKVVTGSGGIHYYFKYTDDLKDVSSRANYFGAKYAIDIKTNGGCVILPSCGYFNKNLKKQVEYVWTKSIFDYEPIELPKWLKKIILDKVEEKIVVKKKIKEDVIEQIDAEDEHVNFTYDDIKFLVDILSNTRCTSYDDWLNVGLCLANINKTYNA